MTEQLKQARRVLQSMRTKKYNRITDLEIEINRLRIEMSAIDVIIETLDMKEDKTTTQLSAEEIVNLFEKIGVGFYGKGN